MSARKSLLAFVGVAALTASTLAFAPAILEPTDSLDGKGRALAAGLELTDVADVASQRMAPAPCAVGQSGPFLCENVDLVDHVPTAGFGNAHGSDSWGWTAEDGTEYVIVTSGVDTGFFRLTEPGPTGALEYLGSLNRSQTADRVLWNDVKVVNDHAYVTSEDNSFGFQIVDLNAVAELPAIPLGTGDGVIEQAGFVATGGGHNMVGFPERDIIAITLAEDSVCGGGTVFYDVSDGNETDPVRLGCVGGQNKLDIPGGEIPLSEGTHDAQCVVYTGPDDDYNGTNAEDGRASDICLMFQEGAGVYVIDVSEITRDQLPDETGRAKLVTRFTYDTINYAHQGWFSPNQRWLLFNDELDESGALATALGDRGSQNLNTTTYWVDLEDLDAGAVKAAAPFPDVNNELVNAWSNPDTLAIDHNMYPVAVEGGEDGEFLLYQANYGAGFRVLRADDTSLADGSGFEQVAYFDTYPGVGPSEFYGAWNTYPFFDSGNIVVSDFQLGLLIFDVDDVLEGRA